MEILENRTLELTIEKIDKNNRTEMFKVFNDLNVKFSYSKYIGASMYGKGKVSICGLDGETLDKLVSFASAQEVLEEKKLIKIKAGYGDKLALIIDGSIMSAMPTIPPDIWLNCEIINSYEIQQKIISTTIEEGLTLEQYAKLVADIIGVQIKMRIEDTNYLNKKMSGTSFIGNAFQLANGISKSFCFDKEKDKYGQVVAYISGDYLIVDYANLFKDEKRTSNPILINKDNGMVGLPEMSMAGKLTNITTLLNPSIETGDVIKLESEQLKSANGLYYVQGITYTGEFRGNAWYSTFTCWRIN